MDDQAGSPDEREAVDLNKGLRCPACDCPHSYVIYTRDAWGGKIQRRRECRACKRRFTTLEKPA